MLPLANLFSKPLNFTGSCEGPADAFSSNEKSGPSENLTSNPCINITIKPEVIELSSQYSGLISSTMPIVDVLTKSKDTTTFKNKKIKPRYADYDGVACAENEFSTSWIDCEYKCDTIHDKLKPQENFISERSLICYEDESSSHKKSRNQRRREKKKMLKVLEGNNVTNNKQTKSERNSRKELSGESEARATDFRNAKNEHGVIKNNFTGTHINFIHNRTLTHYEDDMSSHPKSKNSRGKDKIKKLKVSKRNHTNNNRQSKALEMKFSSESEAMVSVFAGFKNVHYDMFSGNVESFGVMANFATSDSKSERFKDKSLKRKAEVEEGANAKKRRVDGQGDQLQSQKLDSKKKSKFKRIMTPSQQKKHEKSQLYLKKLEEKKTKEANHQQGIQKKIVPCKFYINGCCNKGDECIFSHQVPQQVKDEQCKFYVISQCMKGEACLYRHGEWPCKFFHTSKGCKISNCKFSHEPLTEKTKIWLEKTLEEDRRAQQTEGKRSGGDDYETSNSQDNSCKQVVPSERNGETEIFYGNSMKQNDIAIQLNAETYNSFESFYGNVPGPKHESYGQITSDKFNLIKIDVNKSVASLYKHFEHKIEGFRMGKTSCLEDISVSVMGSNETKLSPRNNFSLAGDEAKTHQQSKHEVMDQEDVPVKPSYPFAKPKLFSNPLLFFPTTTSQNISANNPSFDEAKTFSQTKCELPSQETFLRPSCPDIKPKLFSTPLSFLPTTSESIFASNPSIADDEMKTLSQTKCEVFDQMISFKPSCPDIKPKLFSTPLSFLASTASQNTLDSQTSRLFTTPLSSDRGLNVGNVNKEPIPTSTSNAVHKSLLAQDNGSLQQRMATSLTK